jgi:asparagine synthase (glutamine-hydrolysing)
MCGIAGLIDWRAATSTDALHAIGETMNEFLQHRGPDFSGLWVEAENGVVLTQRRLSIIDLSPSGAQPMQSANHRYVYFQWRNLQLSMHSQGARRCRLGRARRFRH